MTTVDRMADEKHVCAMGRCIRRRYSTCPAVCRARPGYIDPLKKAKKS